MLRHLVQTWWFLNVRGILALIFGAVLFFLAGTMQGPFGTTVGLTAVMLMFVLYLICSAMFSFLAAIKLFDSHARFWAAVAYGAFMLVVAIWIFFSNEFTFALMVWLTAANAFASGIIEIVLGHALRKDVDGLPLQIAGALSVSVATGLILARNASVSQLVLALGLYAIFYGSVLIVFSLRLHGLGTRLHIPETK